MTAPPPALADSIICHFQKATTFRQQSSDPRHAGTGSVIARAGKTFGASSLLTRQEFTRFTPTICHLRFDKNCQLPGCAVHELILKLRILLIGKILGLSAGNGANGL
jgi:hypothetical protein